MFPRPSFPVSVFDRCHELVIFGGGYAGFGAALACAAAGKKVLWVEPSGQLLHESTCGLENSVGCVAQEVSEEWIRWLGRLREKQAADEACFDPAFAEIEAARLCADPASGAGALFYAMPVAVEWCGDEIPAVTFATKAGYRTLAARRWIDASENGLLAVLARPSLREARRAPTERRLAMALQAPSWEGLDEPLAVWCAKHGARARGSLRATERRVGWTMDGDGNWAREMERWLARLREAFPLPSPVIVSHCAMEAVPIYAALEGGGGAAANVARNLTVLSPTLRDEAIVSVGDRFALGAAVAKRLVGEARTEDVSMKRAPAQKSQPVARRVEVIEQIEVDVLVAGAGTSGALAAITAGREGARTCALEFMGFPGGVGTGAGITCYFHGAKGGLQSEIDRRTLELNLLLEGRELPDRRWHHVGKILALLDGLAEARVRFVGRALLAEVRRDGDGRVTDVIAATGEGPVRIVAKSFVDCTGDGDLCAAAGAAFSLGRAGDGRMMAYSQSVFTLRAASEGLVVVSRNFDAGWTDPTDSEELSRARLEGVAQHARPTWEASETPLAVAPLPGVRQSRQIATDYALGLRDLVTHTSFADAVGEAESIADTHSVDLEFEDDEAFFFFCVCRLFRHSLRTQLPYRMLLPRGLTNVWIACRAAGLEPTASYAVRMQRDMQRLGEVAGRVAARCAREGRAAREASLEWWQDVRQAVERRGASAEQHEDPARWMESVARGHAGLPLWRLFVRSGENRAALREIACGREAHPHASFYAAAVLAMWGDPAGEERLLSAIDAREEGPPPSENNTGAHGQEIDIPFWLLAIVLLRRGGTAACLPVLRRVADTPGLLFNVRTAVAITLERLASDGRFRPGQAAEIAELLTRSPLSEVMLAPSHSIWRSLRGEPQLKLRNDAGVDTRQDHSWQLHLLVARIRALAGLPETAEAAACRADPRPWIRRIFEGVSKK